MPISLVIAGKDIRRRLRDRSAYIVGVVAPLVLAGLIALAFGRSGGDFHVTFAVADLDHGPLSTAFVDGVLGSAELRDTVTVRRVGTRDEAVRLAREGTVAAAIVVPAGYSAVTSGGEAVPLRVVRNARSALGADMAVALARSFATRVDASRIAVDTAVAAGAAHDQAALRALAKQAADTAEPVTLTDAPVRSRDISPGSTFAPAMAIFFLYFVVGTQARGIIAERREGTLVRLLAAPVRPSSLLAGKTLAALALGLASLTAVALASSVLLGADWGDPLAAAAVVVSTVLAVTGLLALVLTLARTEQQAMLYTSLLTFTCALLGGNFVTLENAPAFLRRLSMFTPNGWSLRAFHDLSADPAAGLSTVLPAIGVLVAIATAAGLVASLGSRRLVTP